MVRRFLLILAVLLLACPAIYAERDLPKEYETRLTNLDIDKLPKLSWEKDSFLLRPGVRLLRFAFSKPRPMRINLIRIDLTLPNLKLVATGRDKDWGKPMPDFPGGIIRTKRETTVNFMLRLTKELASKNPNAPHGGKVFLAVNTAPWTPWTTPYTHAYAQPAGLQISNGIIVAKENPEGRPYLVMWKNGVMDICTEIKPENYKRIWLATSGFGLCMKDGEILDGGPYEKQMYPRTTIALSRNRKAMFLITADGRQPGWSEGAYGQDMAKILKFCGAWDAIDMDGGGSATLSFWPDNAEKPITFNQHGTGGYLRPVAVSIGFFFSNDNFFPAFHFPKMKQTKSKAKNSPKEETQN